MCQRLRRLSDCNRRWNKNIMTTLSNQKPVSPPPDPLGWYERQRRRLRNNVRCAFTRGDALTFFIVLALLILPVLALETAHWAEGLVSLAVVTFFSVTFGYFLSWSRFSEPIALLISAVYGILITSTAVILLAAQGGSIPARVINFVTRVVRWGQATAGGGVGDDNLVFVLFMAILFWFLGYSTAWHVFRIDRVWRAVLPPGIILIINNFYYLGKAPLEAYLILYIFLALLLVVRSHIDAREYEWYRNRVRYSRHVRTYFLQIGSIIAL